MINTGKDETRQTENPKPISPNTTDFINMIVAQKSTSIQNNDYCLMLCHSDSSHQRKGVIELAFRQDYKLNQQ